MCSMLSFSFPRKPSTLWGWRGHGEGTKVLCPAWQCRQLPVPSSALSTLQINARASQALPGARWTCPRLVHYGDTGWGGCKAGAALWHSQSALISFFWQCSTDCPHQVSQIWNVSCKFVWAVEDASLPSSKEDELWVPCPHESSCRKRGVSHHGQRTTFPLSLPSPKLHNCWCHAGRVPFVLSSLLVIQTSLYLIIYYCSCRTWACHVWGPLWHSKDSAFNRQPQSWSYLVTFGQVKTKRMNELCHKVCMEVHNRLLSFHLTPVQAVCNCLNKRYLPQNFNFSNPGNFFKQ